MKLSPQLKPLFFVIKALTYFFKLNDPKNGGIRTYAIVIMILSFLQN
jgi:DNA polymerase sigma